MYHPQRCWHRYSSGYDSRNPIVAISFRYECSCHLFRCSFSSDYILRHPRFDTLTPSRTWVNSVTLEPMVKQLYLSLWLMDADELQKLSLLFVFQRGDQGATRSAGGRRGSRGPALRGAATAGGELHHPLRYGVSLETLAATKRRIKIDAYNKLSW